MKKIIAFVLSMCIAGGMSATALNNIADNALTANAADAVAQAYLIGTIGYESNWDAGKSSSVSVAEIDGDAQYQVTWDFSETIYSGGSGSWFLAVAIESTSGSKDFTTDEYPDLEVTLDELYVDDELITGYDASNAVDTSWYEGSNGVTRIYIHDDWTGSRVSLIEDCKVESQIKVIFTVSGLGNEGTSNVSRTNKSISGDVNGDGEVTVADAAYIMQWIAAPDAYPLSDTAKSNADVTGDNDGVTSLDALAIQQYLSGAIESFS